MKKNKILSAFAIIMLAITFISLISCRQSPSPASRTEFMLDTICTVTLHNWEGNSDDILDNVFKICRDYEHRLSATISGSDIYKINHSDGKSVTIDSSTASLISSALEYCRMSGGTFDITILPAKELWNFSGNSGTIPSKQNLKKALENVDYTKISLEGNKITVPKETGIDLGAIVKGYIADRIAEYLKEQKVHSAIIDLGGNIYTIGNKPDGTKWRVGIQKPFDENGTQLHTIEISDSSAVTSGIYQRYFRLDNNIYHHILDAKTGMPCNTGLYSVTIIGESSEQCDALSTICMLLGYDKSVEILNQFDNIKAVFITDKFEVILI